jgi:hypothetical protein
MSRIRMREHGRNYGVIWSFVRLQCVGMGWVEGEPTTSILEREATVGGCQARAKAHVITIDCDIHS